MTLATDAILGTDLALVNGDLAPASNGDAVSVSGRACLAEDQVNRLSTPRGTLHRHPEYGFDMWRFIHLEDSSVNRLDFSQSVQETIEQDPRVVPGSASAEVLSWADDVVKFRVTSTPIAVTNPLNLVLVANVAAGTVTPEV